MADLSQVLVMEPSSCFSVSTDDGENTYDVLRLLPVNWEMEQFDYSNWPQVTIYTEEKIGVKIRRHI